MVVVAADSPSKEPLERRLPLSSFAKGHFSSFSTPGMDPEKLKRIQLPVPSEAEKTTYNHLLAERLIRIMNNAAQPGTPILGYAGEQIPSQAHEA